MLVILTHGFIEENVFGIERFRNSQRQGLDAVWHEEGIAFCQGPKDKLKK